MTIPLLLVGALAACGDDDGGDDASGGGGGGGGDNTGEVNILFAGEPDEATGIQGVIDDLINADADYDAEFEASGNFEEQLQIRAEGGTLDLAAVPQPGAVIDLAEAGNLTSLEDLGFDIGELEDTFGEAFLALGEYEGEHYGLPTNINLKSMVWYPKDDFDAAGYVLGGAENTPDIAFGDAPLPMFDDPPKCWLHRQASFIDTFFPEEAEAGVDYDWFPLPPIDQDGILFGGELTVVGTGGNRPEVKDFLDKFISTDVQCKTGEAAARLSPNVDVGADCYGNDNLGRAAEVLAEANTAGTGRFDASDLMPAEVGSGSFWTGMVDYVKSGSTDNAESILADIEASWPS